ncbi:MAG TPA: uracil-DNA glycosylase family protein [Chloroflexota bacterium]|nr:uracil-DNA glycosylase family protein [Chloroflexota bacterium]
MNDPNVLQDTLKAGHSTFEEFRELKVHAEIDKSPPADLLALNRRIRACRLCEEAGYIAEARPVVADGGRWRGMVLIGQAPGIVEHESHRPFGGRAGRELFRWMAGIGIQEDEFRRRVYMAAMTRCFPGKNPSGSGDRKPSRAEINLCRPWLESMLELLEPSVLLLVGQLAIERYLPRRRLEDLIGNRYLEGNLELIPLPHPSGASRWLNAPANRGRLQQGLEHVREAWTGLYV